MLVASEDATAGSVMQNAERISPASSGFSQRCLLRRRSEAVEDLHVAGVRRGAVEHFAGPGDAPITSHSGAYSRLVSPAPLAECGRNMFHKPAARAFGLSCSTSGIGSQRALPSRCATSSAHGLLVRIDVLVEERLEARDQRLDLVGVLELHDSLPHFDVRGNDSACSCP